MATERMNQSWRRIRDRIRGIWEEEDLGTDKEMKKARGSLRMMVNLVHQKTGEARQSVRRKIIAAM